MIQEVLEITCDGYRCYKSFTIAEENHGLIDNLIAARGWIVVDGEHYCSPECVPSDPVY